MDRVDTGVPLFHAKRELGFQVPPSGEQWTWIQRVAAGRWRHGNTRRIDVRTRVVGSRYHLAFHVALAFRLQLPIEHPKRHRASAPDMGPTCVTGLLAGWHHGSSKKRAPMEKHDPCCVSVEQGHGFAASMFAVSKWRPVFAASVVRVRKRGMVLSRIVARIDQRRTHTRSVHVA